jgi:hypothetical protein
MMRIFTEVNSNEESKILQGERTPGRKEFENVDFSNLAAEFKLK